MLEFESFLSSDLTVPHPESTQSYDRYSYGRNNPVRTIDPSGFDDFDFGDGMCISCMSSGEDSSTGGASASFSSFMSGGSYGGTSIYNGTGVGYSLFPGDMTFSNTGSSGDPLAGYNSDSSVANRNSGVPTWDGTSWRLPEVTVTASRSSLAGAVMTMPAEWSVGRLLIGGAVELLGAVTKSAMLGKAGLLILMSAMSGDTPKEARDTPKEANSEDQDQAKPD